MNYLELARKIQQKTIDPLYLLYGPEDFFIKDITEKIVSAALPPEELDFNYSIFDMKETPVEVAVAEGETLPFFGEKRVVLVKNCYFLTAVKQKNDIEHNLPLFERYIANPFQETVMIVTVPHEKLDERKKIVKALKKHGTVLEAFPFNGRDMQEWLAAFYAERQLHITVDAKERLMQLAGQDMNRLISESEKLSLYAGEEREITAGMVNELVPRNLENNIFDLVDHVVRGRAEQAFRVYYDLLKQNEEPVKILTLLARQFRMILHVTQLKRKGYSRQKIAAQLKVHPYAVKIAEAQSPLFTEQKLKEILIELADADYEIKTGKMAKSLRLEMSISRFMHVT
ncbi:DNA polymerase III subunit delta [Bacillus piscicola]|uniref:DNA polymerase III subunit delta n=1 Tax=Bacillus piscicola TaxID=1632684 RepID=UPI001F08ED79|nr:DNA polymerase III subunit delta [Bacillus piscicola]